MKAISRWAKHHRFAAITLLVLIKLLLVLMAFYVGSALLDLNIHIPYGTLIITMIILVIIVLTYPSRWSALSKNQFYIRQKTADYFIAAASFVMIATMVNNNMPLPATTSIASNVTAISTPTAEEIIASLKYRDKSTLTRQEKKILVREFKRQLKVYSNAKLKGQKASAGQALSIIFVILAALGLLYLVAALACGLACAGADGAALLVAIVGAALVIWGTVAAINRISRGPKKKNDTPAAAAN